MKRHIIAKQLANLAVQSLIKEVNLTPKPGLVDRNDQGAHKDLTLQLMTQSANSLYDTFYKMAYVCYGNQPNCALRELFGAIGRAGETTMLQITNGINTHKGAIWSLGLIVASVSMHKLQVNSENEIFSTISDFARIEDPHIPNQLTNGIKAIQKYGGYGAKREAQLGFPHIRLFSYPTFQKKLEEGTSEHQALHYVLLTLIAHLNDTCLLHRGGKEGLNYAQSYARKLLNVNKVTDEQLSEMNRNFIKRNLSPGGSADLLAATLMLKDVMSFIHKNNELLLLKEG